MSDSSTGRRLNDPHLVSELRTLRRIDNLTNLRCLVREYASMALVSFGAIGWSLARQSAGLSWWWDAPIMAIAILFMGGIQHRLAGLAHEASHFTLMRNRLGNDLVADLFCMFPLFATIQQYRVTHLAHHQFVNDWEKDPDLADVGRPKGVHEFPMSRSQFIYRYYLRFLLPWVLLSYMWQIAYLSVFGSGRNPYLQPAPSDGEPAKRGGIRVTSLAGVAYVALFALMMNRLYVAGSFSMLTAFAFLTWVTVVAGLALVPQRMFFQSPLKHAYSARLEAQLQATWVSVLLYSFPAVRAATGVNFAPYFWLLWVVPLLSTFAYFMLLRDVYQHANADQGRLTNSRVFRADPFTQWAVFVYGQDMHLPHHLFPAIPHYNLPKAHELLRQRSDDYREQVVECDGTFSNESGRPSILDVMEQTQGLGSADRSMAGGSSQRRAS